MDISVYFWLVNKFLFQVLSPIKIEFLSRGWSYSWFPLILLSDRTQCWSTVCNIFGLQWMFVLKIYSCDQEVIPPYDESIPEIGGSGYFLLSLENKTICFTKCVNYTSVYSTPSTIIVIKHAYRLLSVWLCLLYAQASRVKLRECLPRARSGKVDSLIASLNEIGLTLLGRQ